MEVKCLLCVGHSDSDVGYVQCPLVDDVICHACCVEISSGAEETRKEIMKRVGSIAEDEIDKACDNCKPTWVKKGSLGV